MKLRIRTRKNTARVIFKTTVLAASCVLSLGLPTSASSDGHISFRDIAASDDSGIDYRRYKSPRDALFDKLKAQPVFHFTDAPLVPMKSRGLPGVAILDFDNDGDKDLYVTNGPGVPNSLYSNQLIETGELSFVDVAMHAGVAATDQDGTGVCYGDIDNDGNKDIYVLGVGMPNRLYKNQGDGTFLDISETSQTGGGNLHPSGCSMGDVNGDGLLDIVVANTWDSWNDRIEVSDAFGDIEHNQLFINTNGHVFEDASEKSGILNMEVLTPELNGIAGMTWAISMVDYDLDGDVDIFMADDQGFTPPAAYGGFDRGLIHLMQNDGNGNFTDVAVETGLGRFGAWMGLAFGDLNSDGNMDVFVSNLGDYLFTLVPVPFEYELGSYASRAFLGQSDGSFTDPGAGELIATFFGWGTVMTDYDNDGDTDIIYHGGQDLSVFVEAANPGAVLNNDGNANFSYDLHALAGSSNHSRRNVQGVAAGDLNNDGFVDIVSTSNFNIPPDFPMLRYEKQWGTVADDGAQIFPSFFPTGKPNEFIWSGLEPVDGTLSVEISSADNGNRWVSVELMGTIGLTSRGKSNRDGIGAVVNFTPHDGKTVMNPVLGGASYVSQDSLEANFGLGEAHRGMVEVLWPGGVRNRLYNLRASESLVLPEIPCSYDADWGSEREYRSCVSQALKELSHEGKLKRRFKQRLMASAMRAFHDVRDEDDDSGLN